MKNTSELIDKILAAKKCGDLFESDATKVKAAYRLYAKQIHPDVCSDSRATSAMEWLTALKTRAEECVSLGIWEATNIDWIVSVDHRRFSIKYLWHDAFELGERYICRTAVVYILNPNAKKYYMNYLDRVAHLHYANGEMRQQMERLVPQIVQHFELSDGRYAIILRKTEDVLPLDLFFKKYARNLDPRHCAWIISRLCGLACFLSYNSLAHNGISMSNLFVSPKYHSILLLGGWWYAVSTEEKMLGTTKDVFETMPYTVKTDKLGSCVTDLESIKAIGRKMGQKTVFPHKMNAWVESGSSHDAIKEFQRWDESLNRAFGARKFVNFDVDYQHFYENV